MALVIVSAGHLTHSRLRTRPVLAALTVGVSRLMATCGVLGYRSDRRRRMPKLPVPTSAGLKSVRW